MRETLQDVIAAEFPPAFISSLIPRLAGVYREAAATMDHPFLGEPERRNLLPQTRRNMIEKVVRDLALDNGIQAAAEFTETNSHEFTVVRTRRVRMTISKTDGEASLPEVCHFRRQCSAVNSMLMQQDFFDVNGLGQGGQEPLYAILTHGPAYGTSELGFVCVGFPGPDMKAWAEPPVSILQIQEKQEKTSGSKDSLAEQEEIQRTPALKEGLEQSDDETDDSEESGRG